MWVAIKNLNDKKKAETSHLERFFKKSNISDGWIDTKYTNMEYAVKLHNMPIFYTTIPTYVTVTR